MREERTGEGEVRGARHVVFPGKWKFDDGSTQAGEREAHPYYARSHERGAKSTSNPLTGRNGRKTGEVIYSVTPPI